MKKYLTLTFASLALACIAQTYQPNWQSLDARPTPQWFKDSKFGIFIHWGVYSVPGWCSKGNYAEWYQYGLQTTDTARMRYHKAKFGNKTYYQLADDFKAELYNPDDWAKHLNNQAPNTLCSHPNITMVIHFGQIKQPTKLGASHGMR